MKNISDYLNARLTGLRRMQGSKGVKRARSINNTLRELRTQLTPQRAKSIGRVWGFAPKQATAARGSGGDTIVEVLIALTVLAVAMATNYGIGARSISMGIEAKKRTEALSLAQSQVDYITAAQKNGNLSPYPAHAYFCLLPNSGNVVAKSQADQLCALTNNGATYDIGTKYNSSTKIFTVTAQWDASGAPNGTANLNLYYKLPG